MPGPSEPRLIVIGKIQVAHGGTRPALELGPVQESDPPVQQVNLVFRSSSGGPVTQMVEEHEVRGEFKALDRYGGVAIHCNGEVLAQIREIERAY